MAASRGKTSTCNPAFPNIPGLISSFWEAVGLVSLSVLFWCRWFFGTIFVIAVFRRTNVISGFPA